MTATIVYSLSVFLLAIGLLIALTKRHALFILIGIELILNAANLNFVLWQATSSTIDGQMAALFIIIIAVCEASVGLAIIIRTYHFFKTVVVDQIHQLNEHDGQSN